MILFYLLACAWFATGEDATDVTNTGNEFPGALHMMGLCLINNLETPSVRCWKGPILENQIDPLLDEIPSDLGPVKSLKLSFSNACAILEDDTVRCWGAKSVLPELQTSGANVEQLFSGSGSICAVLADSSVKCNSNNFNRSVNPKTRTLLGSPGNLYWLKADGEMTCRHITAGSPCKEQYVNQTAIDKIPNKSEWKEVAFGGAATICLILNDNRVHCPLGSGSGDGYTWMESPVDLGQGEVFNLQVTGLGQLCVQRRSDSALVCRGRLEQSWVTARQPEETKDRAVHSYELGQYHVCAVMKDDWSLHCWGWQYNTWVQITKGVTDFIANQHNPETSVEKIEDPCGTKDVELCKEDENCHWRNKLARCEKRKSLDLKSKQQIDPECQVDGEGRSAKRACRKLSGCKWRKNACRKDLPKQDNMVRKCKKIFRLRDPSLCTDECKPVYRPNKRKKYIQCVPNEE